MIEFFDTNILIEFGEELIKKAKETNTRIYLAETSLYEIEDIKNSSKKDEQTKAKARKFAKSLWENIFCFKIVKTPKAELKNPNNDDRIISTILSMKADDLIFYTNDVLCGLIAKARGITILRYVAAPAPENTGYHYASAENYSEILSDEQDEESSVGLNEYLLVTQDNEVVDAYKQTDAGLDKVPYHIFNSDQFGEIKPKDYYQRIAMDSLATNQITMLRGPAGSGKSYLALGYLFQQLEKKKIDKIIIFCNTVATMGSAKLGYYPGDKNTKLLDSQIGNFLSSKIGGMFEVERLITEEKIILLPMSDCRGYDTSGMKAGIYFTEAQNMSIEMMKLFLQRVGEDCICIIDGDDKSQVDLEMYAGENNGMRRVSEVFHGADFYGEVTLKTIYRSKIAALAQKL